MANTRRYLRGPRNEVKAPVDTGTTIETGDLLYMDSDDAKPASTQSDQGTEAANQQLFHDLFLGVAMEPHEANSGAYSIRVATTGVFVFPTDDAASGDRVVGDYIGINEGDDGATLEDQEVTKVSAANAAIGNLVKTFEADTDTTMEVDILSSLRHGGINSIA